MFQLLQRMHQQPKDVAAGNCLRQLALSKNAKRNCQVKLPNTERNHRMPNGNAECRMKIPNAKGYAPKASIFHPVIIFYADRGTLTRLFGPALFGRAPPTASLASAVRLNRPAASALSSPHTARRTPKGSVGPPRPGGGSFRQAPMRVSGRVSDNDIKAKLILHDETYLS